MRPFPELMMAALLGTLTVACSNPVAPTSSTAQAEPTGMPAPSAIAEPSPMDPAGISAARGYEAATAKTKIIAVTGNLAGRIGP